MSETIEWILTIFEVLEALEGTDTSAARHSKSYWLTQDKSVIEMRMCGEELCGYLASDVPTGDDNVSSCGLPLLLGLKAKSAREWRGGWIVDPDTGWAYNAIAKFNKKGRVKITAYEKNPTFGETMKWVQVEKKDASCYNKKLLQK